MYIARSVALFGVLNTCCLHSVRITVLISSSCATFVGRTLLLLQQCSVARKKLGRCARCQITSIQKGRLPILESRRLSIERQVASGHRWWSLVSDRATQCSGWSCALHTVSEQNHEQRSAPIRCDECVSEPSKMMLLSVWTGFDPSLLHAWPLELTSVVGCLNLGCAMQAAFHLGRWSIAEPSSAGLARP